MPLSVIDYFERLRDQENSPSGDLMDAHRTDLHGASALVRRLVPRRYRGTVKTVATAAVRRHARNRAGRLAACDHSLRLNLGCGPTRLSGWVNVDQASTGADLVWDLRWPLPFPDAGVVAIFQEHVLEHLVWNDAVTLVRECRRLLAPGGILRVGVPDFGAFARDYSEGGPRLADVRPGRPTALLGLSELILCYEHRSCWDRETLCMLLGEVGFIEVRACPFGDSRLQPAPDSPHRQAETLYVEAIAPARCDR